MYSAFGLTFLSQIRFPEWTSGAGRSSHGIRIERGRLSPFVLSPGTPRIGDHFIEALPERTRLYWGPEIQILVESGRRITVDAHPDLDPAAVRLCVMGPAIAVLLEQRGYLVLHASAVATAGGAAAFVGHAGAGKSTLAAALNRRGYALLTDNWLAVGDGTPPAALPAFPQIKLLADSLRAVGARAKDHARVERDSAKFSVPVASARFASKPLTLRRIYFLATSGEPGVSAITAQAAHRELMRHAYLTPSARAEQTAAAAFLRTGRLAGRVELRRLVRPARMTHFDRFVQMVDHDLGCPAAG